MIRAFCWNRDRWAVEISSSWIDADQDGTVDGGASSIIEMRKERNMRTAAKVFATTVLLVSGFALAAGPDAGAGYGPGMAGGYGPGMMGGYGQRGSGPGMMGGYGPGMMGGGGPGMMYFGHEMQYSLGLTDEQRKKLDAIHDDMQAKNWEIMGKMRGEMAKMRDLSSAEPLDRNALDDTYKRLNDLRQQRFDARLTARSQIEGLLTKEQKERFKSSGPWWLDETD